MLLTPWLHIEKKWVDNTIQSLYLELNLVLEACKIEVALKYAVVYLTPNTTKIQADILKNNWKFDQFSDQKIR